MKKNTIIISIAVALVLVGIGGYFMFNKDKGEPENPSTSQTTSVEESSSTSSVVIEPTDNSSSEPVSSEPEVSSEPVVSSEPTTEPTNNSSKTEEQISQELDKIDWENKSDEEVIKEINEILGVDENSSKPIAPVKMDEDAYEKCIDAGVDEAEAKDVAEQIALMKQYGATKEEINTMVDDRIRLALNTNPGGGGGVSKIWD
ncbi:MAG: hypothetical protein RR322_05455 [Oscillospiraceae bacterium]